MECWSWWSWCCNNTCLLKRSEDDVRLVSSKVQEAEAPGTLPLPAGRQFHGFATHDWGKDELGRDNHARVSRVVHALRGQHGIQLWFDEEKMEGDINRKIAQGIEHSATMVVFVTDRYIIKASGMGNAGGHDNCKFEFDTALLTPHLRFDKMVAVVISLLLQLCCSLTERV